MLAELSILTLTAPAALLAGGWIGTRYGGRLRAAARRARRRAGTGLEVEPAAGLGAQIADAILDEQFLLAHQPKLRARSGQIDGVEVLVRWRHPERGIIAPGEFIPLAEENGTIRALTEWVLRQTLVEQRRLAACGHALAFNINISARLLADRDFAAWALAIVREASGPLGFEITETAMIADPAGALRNLHLFADAGIRISIDDYGAGLSSLAYLKQLPANELKIDRMFISSLSSSHRDPLLVRSTIDLAHALDMEVVAEGVDSPASQALLKVMGCDILQGFLIATPMPLGELRAFLDARPIEEPKPAAEFNWLGRTATTQ